MTHQEFPVPHKSCQRIYRNACLGIPAGIRKQVPVTLYPTCICQQKNVHWLWCWGKGILCTEYQPPKSVHRNSHRDRSHSEIRWCWTGSLCILRSLGGKCQHDHYTDTAHSWENSRIQVDIRCTSFRTLSLHSYIVHPFLDKKGPRNLERGNYKLKYVEYVSITSLCCNFPEKKCGMMKKNR